ncbi:hypothetical protein N7475_001591 [Penicillium sp. IBT 31633x]|nr:hypothetical protein N7475_001591 [Penicillium sp. IBT 31633x]
MPTYRLNCLKCGNFVKKGMRCQRCGTPASGGPEQPTHPGLSEVLGTENPQDIVQVSTTSSASKSA